MSGGLTGATELTYYGCYSPPATGESPMAHDADYFRRQAAEARSAAFHKDEGESAEIAGHLALAYAALARHPGAPPKSGEPGAVDPGAASLPDPVPLMLQE